MKCGRHSSIRPWLSTVLVTVVGAAGLSLTGGPARAEGEQKAVGICCAWGSRLKDGELTYSVSGDDPTALSIVRKAVHEWDEALPELVLTEVPPNGKRRSTKADIAIAYGPGTADGGESPHATGAQGLTTTYLNSKRMVTSRSAVRSSRSRSPRIAAATVAAIISDVRLSCAARSRSTTM